MWRSRGRGGYRGRGRGGAQRAAPPPPDLPPGTATPDESIDDVVVISANDERRKFVEMFTAYFRKQLEVKRLDVDAIERTHTLIVDFADIQKRCLSPLRNVGRGLGIILQEEPVMWMQCIGVALRATVLFAKSLPIPAQGIRPVRCRVVQYQPITPLRSLKSNAIGTFVALHGTVVRVTRMSFECARCGAEFEVSFKDGRYLPPERCPTRGCRSQIFNPLRNSASTIDWQRVRVQEILEEDLAEQGRVPRTVECELTADLVDTCVPGDVVTISGIVKAVSTGGDGGAGARRARSLFLLYVDANSVQAAKEMVSAEQASPETGEASDRMYRCPFTENELKAVLAIATHEQGAFRLIVNSICSAIYGHELVKAGLTLALFGGVPKRPGGGGDRRGVVHGGEADAGGYQAPGPNSVSIRGDSHVLIVGDPGLGKSQMLQAVSVAAPRGVYVCGNTTSAAGLTVTVVRDSFSGDYALEAGALVLADRGVCAIDEFDKMGHEHHALLEAMEQQSISVAKAGIVCSLPCRSSVIAAANPAGGHYNRAKTVSENLRMGSTLLSRFDLIFILLDKPDVELDQRLSEHVMELHSGMRARGGPMDRPMYSQRDAFRPPGTAEGAASGFSAAGGSLAAPLGPVYVHSADGGGSGRGSGLGVSGSGGVVRGDGGGGGGGSPSAANYAAWKAAEPLADRLKIPEDQPFDPVPSALLRKYVGYAKRYVHPVIGPEAGAVLQEFYLRLRKSHRSGDSAPITTRQLESLIRLAEARAKCELREEVSVQDAHDVVELFEATLMDVCTDDFGVIDMGRAGGTGGSKRAEISRFISAMHKHAQQTYNDRFTVSEMQEIAIKIGLRGMASKQAFNDFIQQLNAQDYFLKKPGNTYKLQSADFAHSSTQQ